MTTEDPQRRVTRMTGPAAKGAPAPAIYEDRSAYASMPPLATGCHTARDWASCHRCQQPIVPGMRAAYLLTGELIHAVCAAS
jgi:hypothetical protein